MAALILIPAALAVLRLYTKMYVFSALTTLSCAALVAVRARSASTWLMAAALVFSAAGDYFMAHRGGRTEVYVLGIVGFFIGHVLFIASSAFRLKFSPMALVAGTLLMMLYAVYLKMRIAPMLPPMLRIPAIAYAVISVIGFTISLMTGDPLYAAAIALLLFSDTMIAESDFARVRAVGGFILPTYYLCHILVALSALIR